MESYNIPKDATGTLGLVKKIIKIIENKIVIGENEFFRVQWDKNEYEYFEIYWKYGLDYNFIGTIGIKEKKDGSVIIDRYLGVDVNNGCYSSRMLNKAAGIHNEVKEILNEFFGEPISEHDGRSIYRVENISKSLEKVVSK